MSLVGGVQFVLSDCSEFVRSAGGVDASGSRILDGEEGTDIGRGEADADWLNRAES